MSPKVTLDAARQVMRGSIVWDNHACMPLRPHDSSFLPQLERCRAGGINVVSLNVGFGQNSIEDHIRMLGHFRSWILRRPEAYHLVRGIKDIHEAKARGQLAICFDIEGMNAISDQISLVGLYYDLGVRWMLIAYNSPNRAGGGCHEEDPGLTDFGRAAIDEMARVGMVVCCTHTGYRTASEVIEHSSQPVIFSHSNPRALCDHPRNIPDDLMVACARKGGVVGINGIGAFLGASCDLGPAVVRHIDYAVRLVGEDHVALGLDYVFDSRELDEYLATMTSTFPPEWGYRPGMAMTEPERMPEIVRGLLETGYGHDTVRKILGENLLRIAGRVWR